MSEEGSNESVLVVAPTPYYIEKGSSLRVRSMLERLVNQNHEITAITYSRGRDGGVPGIKIKRAGFRALTNTDPGPSFGDIVNDIFVAWAALWEFRRGEYDRVQGEDVEGIAIAALVSAFENTTLVYDLHNPLTETLEINGIQLPKAIPRAVERVLYSLSDRVITNWKLWEEQLRSEHGVEQVETVYDSLPSEQEPVNLPTDRYLVYVGNFKEYQGVSILIDAYVQVAEDTELELMLVGKPTDDISRQVRESGVKNEIHLMGRRSIQETNYIIANSQGCAIPRSRGIQPGMKLIHYTMSNRPIIATSLECNGELTEFNNRVLWAEPTVDSLSKRIVELDSL